MRVVLAATPLRRRVRQGTDKHIKLDRDMKKTILLALTFFLAGGLSVSASDAKELWEKNCAKCHGSDGKGNTKMGKKAKVKDMTTAEYHARFDEERGVKSVKHGMKEGERVIKKPAEGLTDAEIKALVAYVRTFKP
jgi:cytochrome c553